MCDVIPHLWSNFNGEKPSIALWHGCVIITLLSHHFYPGPVLAFGYCRCLRLSVCVSICVCSNHMLVRAITHHPFEIGSPNVDHRCKRPWLRSILFWGVIDPDLQGQIQPSRSNSKSKFTPFWACPCDNSSPLQARITKFEPELQNILVNIPVVLGVDRAWLVKFNYFQKSCLFASLLRLWHICETCKNVWKQSLFHILNGCTQICSPTALCHGPWNSWVLSLVWPLLASQSLTRRLANGFSMFP